MIRHARPIHLVILMITMVVAAGTALAGDRSLADVLARGELRHLGIRYANFVTGPGEGLEPDVVRGFAERLGVEYVFVESNWAEIIPSVLGREVLRADGGATLGGEHPVRGDMIATGMTVLPWREQVLTFTRPTFPTQIWLVAPMDSPLVPVQPSHDIDVDIAATRAYLDDLEVLTKENTCLDPKLYDLAATGARIVPFPDALKFMAPATLNGMAATTILDVPDALVALATYPGQIKVIGPISRPQAMAAAFPPEAVALREAYEQYLAEIQADGSYQELVDHYYPAVTTYYPEFFSAKVATP